MQQAGTRRTHDPQGLTFGDLHRWSMPQRTHLSGRNMPLYATGMPNTSRNLAHTFHDTHDETTERLSWNICESGKKLRRQT